MRFDCVPLCVRVSRVSRVCPGSPRCLFTGTCTEIPKFRRSCEYLRTDRPGHCIEKSKSAQNSKWREFESAGLLKVRAERNIGVGALARPKKLKRLARAPEKKQRSAQCAAKIWGSARIHVGRPCAHVSRVIRVSPWLPVAFLPVTESRVSVCVPAPEVSQTSRV